MHGEFLTDRGQVRETNEDAGGLFYNKAGQTLAIVADGMGGHQAGEVASELAVSFIQEIWEKTKKIKKPELAEKWLQDAINQLNELIYHRSQEVSAYNGMGTTTVIAICEKEFVTIANVGDSRCYFITADTFSQITEDHSLVNELVRSGQISQSDAELHPKKNVLVRAVGTEETVKTDIKTISWEENDQLLLCSDGLTNKIEDDQLEQHFRAETDEQQLTTQLIDLANERGGEDNITLAIISNQVKEGDTSC